MEKQDFTIPNISCGHCVAAIKDELSEMDGVSAVDGNPETKVMQVAWDHRPPWHRSRTSCWKSIIQQNRSRR